VYLAHSGVFFLLTLIATVPLVVLVDGVWGGVLVTLVVSLSALFGTLLFFDSRARAGQAAVAA
jgi:hypothetical protein